MTFQKVRIAFWMTLLAILIWVIFVFGWDVFA